MVECSYMIDTMHWSAVMGGMQYAGNQLYEGYNDMVECSYGRNTMIWLSAVMGGKRTLDLTVGERSLR